MAFTVSGNFRVTYLESGSYTAVRAQKPKVHYLCRVIPDVLRFGPVTHQIIERHERFNNVVRGCTIRGSGQANSHNVTVWFAQYTLEPVPI